MYKCIYILIYIHAHTYVCRHHPTKKSSGAAMVVLAMRIGGQTIS